MGSGGSKTTDPHHPRDVVKDSITDEGVHVMEFHINTVLNGVGLVVVFIIVGTIVYKVYRRWLAKTRNGMRGDQVLRASAVKEAQNELLQQAFEQGFMNPQRGGNRRENGTGFD